MSKKRNHWSCKLFETCPCTSFQFLEKGGQAWVRSKLSDNEGWNFVVVGLCSPPRSPPRFLRRIRAEKLRWLEFPGKPRAGAQLSANITIKRGENVTEPRINCWFVPPPPLFLAASSSYRLQFLSGIAVDSRQGNQSLSKIFIFAMTGRFRGRWFTSRSKISTRRCIIC